MIDICIITKLTQGKFFKLIDSIYSFTSKRTIDKINLMICYTGESAEEMFQIENYLQLVHHTLIKRPYNFAKNSNELAKMSDGEVLLFLNDDVELKSDAISHCLEVIEQVPSVGTVGIKLLYPNHTIQHAGQVCFIDRLTKEFLGVGHYLVDKPDQELGDYLAFGNTGAFLMMSRELYETTGGFNEKFEHCFEDVMLNAISLTLGKNNICCASQVAIHSESTTRKQKFSQEDSALLKRLMDEVTPKLCELEDYSRTIRKMERKTR